MKYIVLTFGFIIAFQIQALKAQLRLSVGGGPNFSNISIKNIENLRPNTATNYFLSVRPELAINDKLNVGLDIQFSRKGFNNDVNNNQDISGYRFQYLDLLPQVQYKIMKHLAAYGGLGIAIRTSEKNKINDVWSESVYKITNSSDFTYIAGLRIFPINNLAFHLQYASSIISMADIEYTDSQGQTIDIAKTTLKNLQLGVTYQIY